MKKVIGIVIYLTLLVIIVGCGNTSTPAALVSYPEDSHDTKVIESDELTSSIQQEDSKDNTSVQSVSYGSGNFEDYWEGDSYFDIERFAVDNGSTFTLWLDRTETENISQAVRCTFYFKDGWMVSVITSDGILIEQNGTRTDFLIVCDSKSNHYVSLCKENNVSCSEEVLQSFNTIVECLKTSSDKANPFEGSGLNY